MSTPGRLFVLALSTWRAGRRWPRRWSHLARQSRPARGRGRLCGALVCAVAVQVIGRRWAAGCQGGELACFGWAWRWPGRRRLHERLCGRLGHVGLADRGAWRDLDGLAGQVARRMMSPGPPAGGSGGWRNSRPSSSSVRNHLRQVASQSSLAASRPALACQ